MNHTVRESGNWQHTIHIEVPFEEVEARLELTARKVQARVAMPGFRKGKAPLARVRTDFAAHIEQDLLDDWIPELVGEAIRAAGLSPVVPPAVSYPKLTPGQPMEFDAQVDVAPVIEVKDWQGLPLVRRVRPITDADVEHTVQHLRDDTAVFEDLARPAELGDVVLLDLQRLDANGRRLANTRAKGRRIELGAPGLLPDLERGLLGAEAGQERTISVNYPADWQQEELAGKTVRYVVSVRKIQAKKLRELDDNFARELFRLDSVAELRTRVRQNLEGEDAVRVRRELEGMAVEELIRRNSFELPARLVGYMLSQVIREQTGGREVPDDLMKSLEEHYRPGVERSLKREVLLSGIAKQQSLQVSEEEIAAEIDRMCASDPRQASRVRARYNSAERRQSLGEGLVEHKAMDAVIAAAKLTDEPLAAAMAGAAGA